MWPPASAVSRDAMPLTAYASDDMIRRTWEVEFTDEFGGWWRTLDEAAQDAVARVVGLLETEGPALGFPFTSDVRGTKRVSLRELRIQSQGRPLRVLYAFDPRRVAILLLGGDKTGDSRWYARAIPAAEALYQDHLRTLRDEEIGDGPKVP